MDEKKNILLLQQYSLLNGQQYVCVVLHRRRQLDQPVKTKYYWAPSDKCSDAAAGIQKWFAALPGSVHYPALERFRFISTLWTEADIRRMREVDASPIGDKSCHRLLKSIELKGGVEKMTMDGMESALDNSPGVNL